MGLEGGVVWSQKQSYPFGWAAFNVMQATLNFRLGPLDSNLRSRCAFNPPQIGMDICLPLSVRKFDRVCTFFQRVFTQYFVYNPNLQHPEKEKKTPEIVNQVNIHVHIILIIAVAASCSIDRRNA